MVKSPDNLSPNPVPETSKTPETLTPSETPEFEESSKTSKPKFRAFLPFILIGVALITLIIVALYLGGASSNRSLQNNINDSAIDWDNYTEKTLILSESTTITTPGVYTLSGTVTNGSLTINSTGDVKLILNGLSISNSSGPAIFVAEAKTVILESATGSENYFEDNKTYSVSDEDICATIFSKDDLVLQGSGSITVVGNYEDAIVSKDDLKINSGALEIISKDEGLRGRDSVYIAGGTINISAGGDAIKSNNSEEVGKGYILIDGGELALSADDDGIHAESSLEINGGNISVTKSYEGLEAAKITINSGEISVIATDDGLNAAGGNDSSSPNSRNYPSAPSSNATNYSITINGGVLLVESRGDGIDSNGTLVFNGGEVYVDGPTNSANGALDAESPVIYNGGKVLALGDSGMAVAPDSSSSSGYSISVFFSQTYPADTSLSVLDSSGTTIFAYTSKKTFSHASLSSDLFKEGETYRILINGEEYSSVTLSGKTTQLGSGGFGPGGQGNMNPGMSGRRF